jgi:hypothetical protein
MLLIADSVMTEYSIKIYDHLVTSVDQKILSDDIPHIQHSGCQQPQPVTCVTEVKFNNKPPLNLIFLLILYLVCGCLQQTV